MQCDPKTILENIATSVIVTDNTLHIVFANTASEQLLGMSRTKLIGIKLLDLFDKKQKNLVDSLSNAIKPNFQGFSACDITLCPEPNRQMHVDMNIQTLGAKGKGLVVEIKSIDQIQKVNDNYQRRTQHLAARDLIRSLAHEIKNPLGGIRGAAQLLDMTYQKDDKLREFTKVIIDQTDRLKTLVDNLLGPQRPNPLTMCNIHYIIEKVLSLETIETKGLIRFEKDYDPSLPELLLDIDAIEQTLLNIISNAVQALTEAQIKHPSVKIKTRAQAGAIINGIKYSMSIALDITDNGPGIPEAIKETIFYPMVTSKQNGNGLGLSIAQSIIERHNGTIECESEKGKTTFRILLPLRKDKNTIGA